MTYIISRLILKIFFKILFRIKISGKDNIPKKGAFILACNHVSYLDPLAVGASCPRRLNFMARDDLFKIPLLSKWLTAVGVFPVKRKTADLSALRQALALLKKGNSLLVFPEGTRRINNRLVDPEPGIGFIASKADVAVIPAFVSGTEKALPRGAKFIRPKKIKVYFGQQVHIERREEPNRYQDIAEEIMRCIRHLQCG